MRCRRSRDPGALLESGRTLPFRSVDSGVCKRPARAFEEVLSSAMALRSRTNARATARSRAGALRFFHSRNSGLHVSFLHYGKHCDVVEFATPAKERGFRARDSGKILRGVYQPALTRVDIFTRAWSLSTSKIWVSGR